MCLCDVIPVREANIAGKEEVAHGMDEAALGGGKQL
jgi:hypothetical protein